MKKFIIGALFFAPIFAFAQELVNVTRLAQSIGGVIKILIPIVAALALLYFFWGLGKFILNAGDEEKRKEGKSIMIWGIVALFIITSVWGLTDFIGSALNIEEAGSQDIPTVGGIRR
jgi:uncharacterized membrane protein